MYPPKPWQKVQTWNFQPKERQKKTGTIQGLLSHSEEEQLKENMVESLG